MKKIFLIILIIFTSSQTIAQDNNEFGCSSFYPISGNEYILSFWIQEDVDKVATYSQNTGIYLRFYDMQNGNVIIPGYTFTFTVDSESSVIIDGWQRIIGVFQAPLEAESYMEIELFNNNNSVDVYFDDIRVFPVNGTLKSFVYDEDTQRLMAELDENNYATFYEYDAEGGLIRVKKETEEGVYTIQETRSNTVKSDN